MKKKKYEERKMKVYAKIRQNGEYHSQNISQAVYGFREMGAEIV